MSNVFKFNIEQDENVQEKNVNYSFSIKGTDYIEICDVAHKKLKLGDLSYNFSKCVREYLELFKDENKGIPIYENTRRRNGGRRTTKIEAHLTAVSMPESLSKWLTNYINHRYTEIPGYNNLMFFSEFTEYIKSKQ